MMIAMARGWLVHQSIKMWRRFKMANPCQFLTVIVLITFLVFMYIQLKMNSRTERFTNTKKGRGKLNLDIWKRMCTLNFNSLRQHPFFPSHPQVRSYLEIVDSFNVSVVGRSYGLRVMGYLHSPLSGYYLFRLHSYFMTQFWLSTSGPENATKMAFTTQNKLDKLVYIAGTPKPISERIFLDRGRKYYFEILQIINDNVVEIHILETLRWMLPGTSCFTGINGRYISHYFNHDNNSREPYADNSSPSLVFSDEEDKAIEQYFPSNETAETAEFKQFNRHNIGGLAYLERNYSLMAFQKCKYRPSYVRSSGVFTVLYPKIYPDDDTGHVKFTNVRLAFAGDDRFDGATFMSRKEAESVVKSFMDGIEMKFPRTFELVDMIHMENINDKVKGDRFFLEMVLKRRHDNAYLRVSEHMFRNKSHNELCILEELGWNPNVWIHVIINVKNQADWVLCFIKDISRVMRETGDQLINIIIVDFGNNGLDIDKEMKRYGIKSYNIIKKSGVFHKTASINLAVNQVKDPNSIVLLMDLHLHLPLDFFDTIRKHTFKGLLAFAPILFRLDLCARPRSRSIVPSGFWESLGFGIFSIYKSDWDKFGGMDEQKFKNKWGGEDWDMVTRVLSKGIEIEKQRLPEFYHFYHDKKGMWDKPKT